MAITNIIINNEKNTQHWSVVFLFLGHVCATCLCSFMPPLCPVDTIALIFMFHSAHLSQINLVWFDHVANDTVIPSPMFTNFSEPELRHRALHCGWAGEHGRQRHWNIGGSQVERRRRENWGAVSGEGGLKRGCAPSQKIYEFFVSKWRDMVHSGCVVFKIHVSRGL